MRKRKTSNSFAIFFLLKKFLLFDHFPDFGKLIFVFGVRLFDALAGGVEVFPLLFDADECSAEVYCGNTGRSAAHVRIADDIASIFRQFGNAKLHDSHRLLRRVDFLYFAKSLTLRHAFNLPRVSVEIAIAQFGFGEGAAKVRCSLEPDNPFSAWRERKIVAAENHSRHITLK